MEEFESMASEKQVQDPPPENEEGDSNLCHLSTDGDGDAKFEGQIGDTNETIGISSELSIHKLSLVHNPTVVTAGGDFSPRFKNDFEFINTRSVTPESAGRKTAAGRTPRSRPFLYRPIFEVPEGRDFGRSLTIPPPSDSPKRRDFTVINPGEAGCESSNEWAPRKLGQSDDDYFDELLSSLRCRGNVTAAHINALANLPGLKESADSFMKTNYPAKMNQPWVRPLRQGANMPQQTEAIPLSGINEMGSLPSQRVAPQTTRDEGDDVPVFYLGTEDGKTESCEPAAADNNELSPKGLRGDLEKSYEYYRSLFRTRLESLFAFASSLEKLNVAEQPLVIPEIPNSSNTSKASESEAQTLECFPVKIDEVKPTNQIVVIKTSPQVEKGNSPQNLEAKALEQTISQNSGVSEDSEIKGQTAENNSTQNDTKVESRSRIQRVADFIFCRKRRNASAVVPEVS